MRFGVSFGNHGNGIHVEDVVLYLRNALLTAGEDAYLLPGLLTQGVNVLLENFTREQVWQIKQLRKAGRTRLVVVVSEFTDGRRFNPHITSGDGHYVDAAYWTSRFENFLEVAVEADAIWSLSDYALPEYRALFPDKPVLSFPIGFDPLLPYRPPPPSESKDIDLLFTGSLTPHRLAIVERLKQHFFVLTAPVTTLAASRVDFVRRAKVSLHLNLLQDAIYSSVMRHHFLVMNGAAVISERARTVGPVDEFLTQFDGPDFVDCVSSYMAAGEWRSSGPVMRERYREAMPLAARARQLLIESDLAVTKSAARCERTPSETAARPTRGSPSDEQDAQAELENLLAYDWTGDREEFFARTQCLYDWAKRRPELYQWMGARIAEIACGIRPPLSHPKLWPLAFLLGQHSEIVVVNPNYNGHLILMYRSMYYALPTGTEVNAQLLDGAPPPGLISSPSLAELRSKIAESRDPIDDALGALAIDPSQDGDIAWLAPPELVASHERYNILSYLNVFWGLPQSLGAVDITLADKRKHPAILMASTQDELVSQIDALAVAA